MKKAVLLLLGTIFVSGCATYRLDEAQDNLRSSFATHNFDKTVALLEKYNRKDIYKSKDEVLYNLEMATAEHFNARYDSSTYYFSQAEEKIDDLFTKSISQGIASFLFTNDNSLSYNGESYEDVYLNAFKSLNFIHRGDLEGALVEARRMAYKLSRIELKYKGVAEALAKADTLNKGDWKTGESSVQNSALSHYLASVLYAKSGKADDARIEYEEMLQALNEQPETNSYATDRTALQQIKNANAYNVLLVGFAGRAPIKYQNDVRLYLDEADLYLKFSLPSLRLYQSRVKHIQAVFNDSTIIPLQQIEQMDAVAKEVYKVKEPIIYARTFVRSLTKAIGTNAAGRVTMVADSQEREDVRDERLDQQRNASLETMKKMARELGADYMMIGNINSIVDESVSGKEVAVFYTVNLELIDIETNRKVWIGNKKIKKFIERKNFRG